MPAASIAVLPRSVVQVKQRPCIGAGDVDRVQPVGKPTTGLTGVRDLGRRELFPGDRQEPIQAAAATGSSEDSQPVETAAPNAASKHSAARSDGRCCRPSR